MNSDRRVLKRLTIAIGAGLTLTACATQPTGVIGQRTCGGPALDCRSYFEQSKRSFSANLSTFFSTGAGIGVGSSQLIALDAISGDAIAQYQRCCQQYNACLISEEELRRRTIALEETTAKVRVMAGALSPRPSDSTSSTSSPPSLPTTSPPSSTPSTPSVAPPEDQSFPAPPASFSNKASLWMRVADGMSRLLFKGISALFETKPADLSLDAKKKGSETPPGGVLTPEPPPSASSPVQPTPQASPDGNDLFKTVVTELGQIARPRSTGGQIRAVLGEVSYRDSDFASPLGVYLKNQLRQELNRSGAFILVESPSLRGVEVVERPRSTAALAAASGADVAISGNYWDSPDTVEVFVSIRQPQGDQVLGVARALVPMTSIPPNTPAVPANLTSVRENERIEDRIAPASALQKNNPFKVEVWTDRGKAAVYREGEEVSVMVRVSRDSYLYLYYTDANNQTYQIFPNRYHRNAWIRSGGIVTIPAPEHPFLFRVKTPFGIESIMALASRKPIPDPVLATETGGTFPKVARGLRGLEVVAKAAEKENEMVRDSTVLTTVSSMR